MRAGQLPDTVNPAVMASVFDSFLQGVSILARDNVPHATLDAAINQLLLTWDIAASTAPPIRPDTASKNPQTPVPDAAHTAHGDTAR